MVVQELCVRLAEALLLLAFRVHLPAVYMLLLHPCVARPRASFAAVSRLQVHRCDVPVPSAQDMTRQ